MEYINKNPQVLSQLAVAIENFNKLSPEQQKAVSNAFKEIQGEVDRVYTIIQQNSVEKNE
jgi:TRAP-type C4-dicarboxylate transport system substrate-binding protein